MQSNHLAACQFLKTGQLSDCRCDDEVWHYTKLTLISFFLFAAELVGGRIFGSLALVSDSFHVLVDGSESYVSMIVSKRARTSTDEKLLRRRGGYLSALLLIGVALWIILIEAPERMSNPHEIEVGYMIALGFGGLFANIVMYHMHIKAHKEHKNETHWWQKVHIIVDTGASVLVILGGIAIWMTGLVVIDTILSFFLGGLILFIALRRLLVKPSNGHDHCGHDHHHHH